MLDRESTFADPKIVELLKSSFVPVAIDQAYQRRQKDREGEFYRQIAGQGPRDNFQQTTQGLYTASPDGTLLGYNNNRGPERVMRMMMGALDQFEPRDFESIDSGSVDQRYNPSLPENGLAVRVRAKILGGYEPTDDPWRQIFQSAISRDNLWITEEERDALRDGSVLPSLQTRIARFHLVDNTRGEPPMWRENEIRQCQLTLEDGNIRGQFRLATEDGSRTYEGELFGHLETDDEGNVTRFDLVAKGLFQGEGRYTRGAPKGEFPLAVSFSLADGSDTADAIPPQGSRGWIDGYLK